MSWLEIRSHEPIIERFRSAARRGRLASTFLFVGPAGVGKRTFARKLAQALLCDTHPEEELQACGRCPACQQLAANTHPDLILVAKPADKTTIPLSSIIGDDEHRMREGLCHDIGLKPFCGRRKIAIIDDADFLNEEGANALLKTLEEPPSDSMLILIATNEQRQLPTIRSRCQIVRFGELEEPILAALLLEQGIAQSPEQATELAAISHGSLVRSRELAEPEFAEFRRSLLEELGQISWPQLELAARVNSFMDAAGKDTPVRRARLRQVIGVTLDLFRNLLGTLTGATIHGDRAALSAAQNLAASWAHGTEGVALCLESSHAALGHIDANATPHNVTENWLDEIATIYLRGRLSR